MGWTGALTRVLLPPDQIQQEVMTPPQPQHNEKFLPGKGQQLSVLLRSALPNRRWLLLLVPHPAGPNLPSELGTQFHVIGVRLAGRAVTRRDGADAHGAVPCSRTGPRRYPGLQHVDPPEAPAAQLSLHRRTNHEEK